MYDLILTNATVYDSASALRGVRRDIAVEGGRIAAVAQAIDPSLARDVRDLSGYCVSAGWIDLHVHVYGGLALRDMQMVGVLQGVTTVADAGDFGTATFDDFETMIADSVADVYGFVHIDQVGIPYTALGRADYARLSTDALVELMRGRSDRIKGIKLGALGDLSLHNIEVVKNVAIRAGARYYMHLGEVNFFPAKRSLTRQAVALLTEGDIATHIYTNDLGRIVEDGRVVPEVVQARDRGVVFDIGYGVGNFSFAIAEQALDQGIVPHTISSDQNSLCAAVRADLPGAMSRMFALGMSVEDIVEKVTAGPARALGLDDAGALLPSRPADLTVFRLETGDFEVVDADRAMRRTGRRIVADHVYKDGLRHDCDVERIYHKDNFVMKVRPAAAAARVELDGDERRFMARLFGLMESTADWRGAALHRTIDQAIAATGVTRRKALEALYRIFLADESAGFTPQMGCILARMGAEDLRPYREALRPQTAATH